MEGGTPLGRRVERMKISAFNRLCLSLSGDKDHNLALGTESVFTIGWPSFPIAHDFAGLVDLDFF